MDTPEAIFGTECGEGSCTSEPMGYFIGYWGLVVLEDYGFVQISGVDANAEGVIKPMKGWGMILWEVHV